MKKLSKNGVKVYYWRGYLHDELWACDAPSKDPDEITGRIFSEERAKELLRIEKERMNMRIWEDYTWEYGVTPKGKK